MQKLQLTIPTPCHEDWNNMTPEGKGRFCGSCAKQVIDFSVMTDNQVLQYFANLKNENVCGRVYPDQLNRTILVPDLRRKKIWMYWHYLVAVLLFFFTKSQQAKAQVGSLKTEMRPVKPVNSNTDNRIRLGGIRKLSVDEQKRTINVQDENGGGIPFASLEMLPGRIQLQADSNGKININTLAADSIKFSAVGYDAQTISLADITETVRLTKHLYILEAVTVQGYGITTGKIMMAGGISYTRVVKACSLKDTLRNLISSPDNQIRIHPNPVQKGNTINLSLAVKKTGPYQIAILDVDGRQLFQQNILATSTKERQQLTIPVSWASGMYFVKIVDEKNKTIAASKFVVE